MKNVIKRKPNRMILVMDKKSSATLWVRDYCGRKN
mgnify:CR=1 FL=1